VLFCDLVGSTELSTRLDPEDMRDVLLGYQEACSKVIARYDGFVAKFMGDGVYAYFGYPRAHEDDAERAINTGLGIIEAITAQRNDLAVRIGVATGNVAVGDLIGEGASEEANVVGEAPNLAGRLQGIAEPNMIVIGEATHTLAGGMFETTNLGAQNLKGFSDPVAAWAVLKARATESRFQATRGKHLTDLIGREEELGTLQRRWQRAREGEGQLVLISGEPGIGKSRLSQALQDAILDEPHTRLRYQCSPYHTNSVLRPIIEQFERVADMKQDDSPDVKLDKLENALARSGRPVEDAAPLIASLLSIPTDYRYPALNVSPQRQKEMTLEALVDQMVGLATQQPLLFMFEDAHWIDPTTRELLDLAIERVPDAAILMLITYRPEFDAPWVGRARVTPMILNRLEHRDCALMVENVARSFGIAGELRDRIAKQTDGVPLFIEELTKSVLETATGPGTTIEVPATLQDSLEARLDRLGTAKEVAEIGSAIGRTFDYDLLSRVTPMESAALESALAALVESGLATVRGAPPNAIYMFKHALVQDTAYASLLRDRRSQLHGRIAVALKEKFPEIDSTEPELLARHFTEAGQTEIAIAYWKRAGENCWERPAITEAIEHFGRGIELAQSLPDADKASRLELDLLTCLAPIIQAAHGWGGSESVDHHARAQSLARALNDTEKLFPSLWGSWTINRGQQKNAKQRKLSTSCLFWPASAMIR
jgi:class 3 adenylate cyclase